MDPSPTQEWRQWGLIGASGPLRQAFSYLVFADGRSSLLSDIVGMQGVTLVTDPLSPTAMARWSESMVLNFERANPPRFRNRLLTLRIPLLDTSAFLESFLGCLDHFSNVPCLRLYFPFSLLPSLLDTTLPTLTSILRHPSLPIGRDVLSHRRGLSKRIVIGTHSLVDANALRGKIEELGELEVPVDVVVFEEQL